MNKTQIEIIGDNYIGKSVEILLRSDAFKKSDDEKIKTIRHHYGRTWAGPVR